MSSGDKGQFNIRSSFDQARAHDLAKLTGLAPTQGVEDAFPL
jgi:hypothetical protein